MKTRYETPNGPMYVIEGAMPIFAKSLGEGKPFEPHLTDLINKHVHAGMNVIDCGANFGFHSIHLAKNVGSNGKLHSIEAHPSIYPFLEENLSLTGLDNFKIYSMGVWSKEDVLAFRVNSELGSSSFTKFWRNKSTCVIKVPVNTLDSILGDQKIDFIKIDVEGGELEVLKGAKNLLQTCKPLLVVEWSPRLMPENVNQALWSFLQAYNYRVSRIKKNKLTELHSLQEVIDTQGSRDVFCQ